MKFSSFFQTLVGWLTPKKTRNGGKGKGSISGGNSGTQKLARSISGGNPGTQKLARSISGGNSGTLARKVCESVRDCATRLFNQIQIFRIVWEKGYTFASRVKETIQEKKLDSNACDEALRDKARACLVSGVPDRKKLSNLAKYLSKDKSGLGGLLGVLSNKKQTELLKNTKLCPSAGLEVLDRLKYIEEIVREKGYSLFFSENVIKGLDDLRRLGNKYVIGGPKLAEDLADTMIRIRNDAKFREEVQNEKDKNKKKTLNDSRICTLIKLEAKNVLNTLNTIDEWINHCNNEMKRKEDKEPEGMDYGDPLMVIYSLFHSSDCSAAHGVPPSSNELNTAGSYLDEACGASKFIKDAKEYIQSLQDKILSQTLSEKLDQVDGFFKKRKKRPRKMIDERKILINLLEQICAPDAKK